MNPSSLVSNRRPIHYVLIGHHLFKMIMLMVIVTITLAATTIDQKTKWEQLDLFTVTTDGLVDTMGYKSEVHDVFSNGYVIRLTRMINPLANKRHVKRTILFLHGVIQDSVSEFLAFARFAGPKKPAADSYSSNIYANTTLERNDWLNPDGPLFLPFIKGDEILSQANSSEFIRNRLAMMCLPCLFSNANYDVWLMDERGVCPGSLQVTKRSLREPKNYWNFRLDDSALDDLPRVIDYVHQVSDKKKISFLGMSKGTASMFMMLSQYPHYANKIETYVALAPIVFNGGVNGIFNWFVTLFRMIEQWNEPTTTYPMSIVMNRLSARICGRHHWTFICNQLFQLMAGPDPNQDNIVTELVGAHSPRPQSFKTIAQLSQLLLGKVSSNSSTQDSNHLVLPFKYDLSRIILNKIILVRSTGNDVLSIERGHKMLARHLKVPIFKDIVVPRSYNHLGLVLNKNAFHDVFLPVLQAVNEAYAGKT